MESLWQAGASVRAYDPVAMDEARRIYPDQDRLVLCESANETLAGADVLAIVTEWQEFRSPDFPAIKQCLKSAAIFDGRNLYDPATLSEAGLQYFAIGRSNAPSKHGVTYRRRRSDSQ